MLEPTFQKTSFFCPFPRDQTKPALQYVSKVLHYFLSKGYLVVLAPGQIVFWIHPDQKDFTSLPPLHINVLNTPIGNIPKETQISISEDDLRYETSSFGSGRYCSSCRHFDSNSSFLCLSSFSISTISSELKTSCSTLVQVLKIKTVKPLGSTTSTFAIISEGYKSIKN